MKIPIKWSSRYFEPNWSRNILPKPNPRTYVPRIVFPTRTCPYTKRFVSSVDVDHTELQNCCGKIKNKCGTFSYVFRTK